MDANPYAPPKARVSDVDAAGLKHRSVWMMVLFTVISLGIYYLIWWLRRRDALNRLNSSKKVAIWPLLLLGLLFAGSLVLGILAGSLGEGAPIVQTGNLVSSVVQIVVSIAMLIQTFRVKDIIEDHAAPDPHSDTLFVERVQLSGLMTFFFSIYYLQWAINRHIVARA